MDRFTQEVSRYRGRADKHRHWALTCAWGIQVFMGDRAPSCIVSGGVDVTQQYVLMSKGEDCVLKSQEAFRETDKGCTDTAITIQTKLKFYKAVRVGWEAESVKVSFDDGR